LKLYNTALKNVDVYNRGINWHPEARSFVQGLSQKFGVNQEVGAGVTSALSAQNEWNNNKREADIVFRAYKEKIPADTKEISKAFTLREGLNQDQDSIQKAYNIISAGKIGGLLPTRKQGNFAASLQGLDKYFGKPPVTVDTWGIHAWLGGRENVVTERGHGGKRKDEITFEQFRGQTFSNYQGSRPKGYGLYDEIADDFRTVAGQLKVKPEDFQAVVWSQIKDEHPELTRTVDARTRIREEQPEIPFARGYVPDYAYNDPKDLKGFANFGPPPKGYIPWKPSEEEVAKIKAGGRITKWARWDNMSNEDRFDLLQKHYPDNNIEKNRKLSAKRWADVRQQHSEMEFVKGFIPSFANFENIFPHQFMYKAAELSQEQFLKNLRVAQKNLPNPYELGQRRKSFLETLVGYGDPKQFTSKDSPLSNSPFAILTAENPNAEILPAGENILRNRKLLRT